MLSDITGWGAGGAGLLVGDLRLDEAELVVVEQFAALLDLLLLLGGGAQAGVVLVEVAGAGGEGRQFSFLHRRSVLKYIKIGMTTQGNPEATAMAITSNVYLNSTTKYVKISPPKTAVSPPRTIPMGNISSTQSLRAPSQPSGLSNLILQNSPVKRSSKEKDKTAPLRTSPEKEQLPARNSIEEKAMHMSANIFMNATTKFMKGFADLSNVGRISPTPSKKPSPARPELISAAPPRKSLAKKEGGSLPQRARTPEKTAMDLTNNNYMNATTKFVRQISGSSQVSIEANPSLKYERSPKKETPAGTLQQLVSPIKSSISLESRIKINVHTFNKPKEAAAEAAREAGEKREKQDRSRSNSQEAEKRRIERRNLKTRELKFGEKKDEKSATNSKLELNPAETPIPNAHNNPQPPSNQNIPSAKSLDVRTVEAKSPISRNNYAQKPVENRISDARSADARQPAQRREDKKEEKKEEKREEKREEGEKLAPFTRQSQQVARKPLLRKSAATEKEIGKEEKAVEQNTERAASSSNKEERPVSPRKNSPGLQGCKKEDARQVASIQAEEPAATPKPTARNVNNKLPSISTIKEEKSEEPQLSPRQTYPRKYQQEAIKESEIKPKATTSTLSPNSAGFDRLWQSNNSANARIVRDFDQKNSQLNKQPKLPERTAAKSPQEESKPAPLPVRKLPAVAEEKEEPKRKIIERKPEAVQPKKELIQTQPTRPALQSPPPNPPSPALTQKLSPTPTPTPTPYQRNQYSNAQSAATTSVVNSVKSQINSVNSVLINQPKPRPIVEKKTVSPPKPSEASPKKEVSPKKESVLSVTPVSPPTKTKPAVSPKKEAIREITPIATPAVQPTSTPRAQQAAQKRETVSTVIATTVAKPAECVPPPRQVAATLTPNVQPSRIHQNASSPRETNPTVTPPVRPSRIQDSAPTVAKEVPATNTPYVRPIRALEAVSPKQETVINPYVRSTRVQEAVSPKQETAPEERREVKQIIPMSQSKETNEAAKETKQAKQLKNTWDNKDRDNKPLPEARDSNLVIADKRTETTDLSKKQSVCSDSKVGLSKFEETVKTAITRTASLHFKRSPALPLAYIKFVLSRLLSPFALIKSRATHSEQHQKELLILLRSSQDLVRGFTRSQLRSGFEQLRRNWANSHLQKKSSRVRDSQRETVVATILQSLAASRLRSSFSSVRDSSWLARHAEVRERAEKAGTRTVESSKASQGEKTFYVSVVWRIGNSVSSQVSRGAFHKILLESISNRKKLTTNSLPSAAASIIQSKSTGKLAKPPRDYESEKQALHCSKGELEAEVGVLDSRLNEKRKYNDIEKGRLIKRLDEASKKNKSKEAEAAQKRAAQKELKAAVEQLPPLRETDLELPEGEPLVGLLTEIYAEVFATPSESVCIVELMRKYSLHREDHNPLLEEWEGLRRNAELRRAVGRWEGSDPREQRTRTQLASEAAVVRTLMANYARERYLWEYVRTASLA